eukprot:3787641-Pyramimonas_sp.AAC.1
MVQRRQQQRRRARGHAPGPQPRPRDGQGRPVLESTLQDEAADVHLAGVGRGPVWHRGYVLGGERVQNPALLPGAQASLPDGRRHQQVAPPAAAAREVAADADYDIS